MQKEDFSSHVLVLSPTINSQIEFKSDSNLKLMQDDADEEEYNITYSYFFCLSPATLLVSSQRSGTGIH